MQFNKNLKTNRIIKTSLVLLVCCAIIITSLLSLTGSFAEALSIRIDSETPAFNILNADLNNSKNQTFTSKHNGESIENYFQTIGNEHTKISSESNYVKSSEVHNKIENLSFEASSENKIDHNELYNTEVSIIASGTFSTSIWSLDSEGVLHIQEGSFPYTNLASPWYPYRQEINKIVFEGKVIAGARSNYLFKDLSNVISFENMENFDMSNVRGGYSIFENCSSLISLDLSQTKASFIANDNLFSGCTSLEKLNVKGVKFDINSRSIFKNNYNLSEITIDTNFRFATGSIGLPEVPNNEIYSGKWINVGNGSVDKPLGTIILSSWFLTDLSFKTADTYVWHKNPVKAKDLTVLYQDTNGNEIKEPKIVSGNIGDTFNESPSTIVGYTFMEIKDNKPSEGTLSDKEQVITFVYKKNPIEAKKLKNNEINEISDSFRTKKTAKDDSNSNQRTSLPKTGETQSIFLITIGLSLVIFTSINWFFRQSNEHRN